MNPGKLRYQITFEEPAALTANADRSPTEAEGWTAVATVRAMITEDGGREDVRAGQHTPRQRVTFRVRKRTDVTEAGRIIFDGGVYRTEGISVHSRFRRYMDVNTVYSGELNAVT